MLAAQRLQLASGVAQLRGWLDVAETGVEALTQLRQSLAAVGGFVRTEARLGEDLMVAIDVIPSEITGWADIVLPESTYLERCDEVHTPRYKTPFLAVRQAAVEPMYDSKPGWWIAKELAHRIGLADYFPWKDSIEYAKHRVKEGGFDCDELMTKGVITRKADALYIEDGIEPTFDTPSGKIELFSQQLADNGFDPIPVYTPPEEPPPGHFRLLFGRAPTHTFGRTTNNRFLSEVYSENQVWLNAKTAGEMGFADGERVILVNQDDVRSEPIRIKVTQRIRHDCVYMVHGYGHSAKGLSFARGRGASDSRLVTRYKTDPIMGGTGMNVNFVRIERAAA